MLKKKRNRELGDKRLVCFHVSSSLHSKRCWAANRITSLSVSKIRAFLFETYTGCGNNIHETTISTLRVAAFTRHLFLSSRSGLPSKQHGKRTETTSIQNPSGPMARIEATGFESLKAEDAKEKKWSARQRRKNSQGRAEFLKVSPIHDQTD